MTDADLTAIYKRANGEDVGKPQPITTQRVFKAMRAMLTQNPEPTISTDHGPWLPSRYHEDETYCERCYMRSKFVGAKDCTPHIVYPEQPTTPTTP